MDKELFVVVPNETAAYNVVKTLKALDDAGTIELYSSTVIAKLPSGELLIKDSHQLSEPWGTLLGVPVGMLIGMLGGPVGVAVGAAVGGAAGFGLDLAYSGFAGDFVYSAGSRLQPGAHAVCASVWEDWTFPTDQELAAFGAVASRQATEDVIVAQIRSDWQDLKDQQAHLEAEISHATGEAKAKLEARRNELRARQAEQRKRMEKRVRTLEESWQAKIASIKAKADATKGEIKARHEKHAEKLARFAAAEKKAFQDLFA